MLLSQARHDCLSIALIVIRCSLQSPLPDAVLASDCMSNNSLQIRERLKTCRRASIAGAARKECVKITEKIPEARGTVFIGGSCLLIFLGHILLSRCVLTSLCCLSHTKSYSSASYSICTCVVFHAHM